MELKESAKVNALRTWISAVYTKSLHKNQKRMTATNSNERMGSKMVSSRDQTRLWKIQRP